MTMNPSRQLLVPTRKVFVLIVLQVILIHIGECQWEVVMVCNPRRVLRRLEGERDICFNNNPLSNTLANGKLED